MIYYQKPPINLKIAIFQYVIFGKSSKKIIKFIALKTCIKGNIFHLSKFLHSSKNFLNYIHTIQTNTYCIKPIVYTKSV